ncbi:MAG: DHH family phosphoesterase [Armatimonadota bacterium]
MLPPDLAQKALKLLNEGNSFIVTSHVNPEGDAIGSMLAVGLVLEGMGKQVSMILQDPIPQIYHFLPACQRVKQPPMNDRQEVLPERQELTEQQTPPFDTAVVVDCEGISRVGKKVVPLVQSASRLLVVDHHPAEAPFGDVEIRDPSAAAAGELVYLLFKQWNYRLTPEIAECLLTAVLVDTGGFRYSNTSPRALRVAAELVDLGANFTRVVTEIFENKPVSSIKLMGRALAAMQTTPDGLVAYSTLTKEDFDLAGAVDNETEGIVNQLLFASGAKASALFRETRDGIRVSLRSREGIDVNRVARAFGGGGHVRASGCTLSTSLTEAVNKVLAEIAKQTALSAVETPLQE